MLILPFTSSPDDQVTVLLGDGNKYVFEITWNEQAAFWSMAISRDTDQVLLVSGVQILLGQDLLSPYGLGIGQLVAIDTGPDGIDAGVDDLGDRVIVVWLADGEAATLPAIAAGAVG